MGLNNISDIEHNKQIQYFQRMFFENYDNLCLYVYRYVQDYELSKDIVSEVYLDLWEKKDELNYTYQMQSLLFRSARNKAINYLKSLDYRQQQLSDNDLPEDHSDNFFKNSVILQDEVIHVSDMRKEIYACVKKMPDQRRKIFVMSREKGLRNKEIAEQLEVSVKAVEKQITQALREIRLHLIQTGYIAGL